MTNAGVTFQSSQSVSPAGIFFYSLYSPEQVFKLLTTENPGLVKALAWFLYIHQRKYLNCLQQKIWAGLTSGLVGRSPWNDYLLDFIQFTNNSISIPGLTAQCKNSNFYQDWKHHLHSSNTKDRSFLLLRIDLERRWCSACGQSGQAVTVFAAGCLLPHQKNCSTGWSPITSPAARAQLGSGGLHWVNPAGRAHLVQNYK